MSSSQKKIQEESEPKFCTESSYSGQLDDEGKMTGFGTYRYPNGTMYQGHFKSGVFHGRGMILHPSKFKMCGLFVKGKCTSYEIYFGDGLEFHQNDWNYCSVNDRRFWIETIQGISPVGETFLTKEKPARHIPKGLYDTEEGFYDLEDEFIVNAENGERIRYVCPDEKRRIVRDCRMNAIDFQEQEELAHNSKNHDISTDSWISSDDDDYYFK